MELRARAGVACSWKRGCCRPDGNRVTSRSSSGVSRCRRQPDLKAGLADQGGHGGGADVAGLGDQLADPLLVDVQPCRVVPARLAELLSEEVAADHGDAVRPPTAGPGE